MPKYSVILGNLGNTCDRFLSSGYKEQPTKEQMIERASRIDGVSGVELVGSWDVTEGNAEEVGALLRKHNLECVSIIPDHFAQRRWGMGAFTSRDPSIRRQAVDEACKAAETAKRLSCPLINLWPGQDGYDYPLQGDFMSQRRWLAEGLKEVAAAFPNIRFSLEYKMKEPRTHSFLARAADTLLVVDDIGLDNVGVTIDTGHSLLAGENIAESAVILQTHGNRLFHLHFNDNYRSWDDDMIVGSVHLVEYVELLFWLKETGYSGWYSMDQYPYREDAQGALRESVDFLRRLDSLLDSNAMLDLRNVVEEGDPVKSTHWIRNNILR
jgi:sugar phosphate isomerase/epimerase